MISVDRAAGTVTVDGTAHALDSPEAFAILSDLWMDAAMRVKHPYTLTWMGRPVIQFADDLMRLQELIYRAQPDVVLETGVAHGGSLVFHASLCRILGRGRVIGVDIEIRPHNRTAIEAHPLAPLITLVEGSSTDPAVVDAVRSLIGPDERVLLVLDSDHRKDHVLGELDAYAALVSPGSYAVAMDGHVMQVAADAPQAAAGWATDNPTAAIREFAAAHPEFVLDAMDLLFNESGLTEPMSGFRGGVLRRVR